MLAKSNQDKRILLRLCSYAKPYIWLIIIGIICLGAEIAFDITFATLQEPYVTTVKEGVSLYQHNGSSDIALSGLRKLITLFTILMAVLLIGILFDNIIWHVVTRMINKDLSIEYIRSVLLAPFSKIEGYHSGDLVNRLSQDISSSINIVSQLVTGVPVQTIIGVIALILLIKMNWSIALMALVAGLITIYLPRVFDKKIYEATTQLNIDRSSFRGFLQETLQGVSVIKGSNLQKWTIDCFAKQREKIFEGEIKVSLLRAYSAVIVSIVYNILTLAVYWIIVTMSVIGRISAGSLMVAMILISRVWRPIESISFSFSEMQQVISSSKRVFEIVDLTKEKHSLIDFGKADDNLLVMEDVTFAFPNNEDNILFNNFNLIVQRGETVGIVGPSGSGKTTLAKLCLGLYKPREGQVKVLGNSFLDNPLEIRSFLAYVPQEPYIFTGTIRDNVTLGEPNLTDEQVIKALEQANAWGFVSQLPAGLKTNISEAGKDLSGGERQRIALARAFLRQADLVVLDEPTSALDNENQTLITEAIDKLSARSATIIIAHRLSTVKNADRILVLDKGQIVEEGNHNELLALNGLYAKLYAIQSKEGAS